MGWTVSEERVDVEGLRERLQRGWEELEGMGVEEAVRQRTTLAVRWAMMEALERAGDPGAQSDITMAMVDGLAVGLLELALHLAGGADGGEEEVLDHTLQVLRERVDSLLGTVRGLREHEGAGHA